jgi:hypothetical protein
MSKPSWSDAPFWAMWLACDEDGEWLWYELEPRDHIAVWIEQEGSKMLFAGIADELIVENWRETLEKRP